LAKVYKPAFQDIYVQRLRDEVENSPIEEKEMGECQRYKTLFTKYLPCVMVGSGLNAV
jgi:hypothetical protein